MNPYRGLESYNYNQEDANLFFGRAALIRQLAATVEMYPLTMVLGVSGTGKSSLVKAGLLPHLKQPGIHVDASSRKSTIHNQKYDWSIPLLPGKKDKPAQPIRPGEHPLRELQRWMGVFLPQTPSEAELRTNSAALASALAAWQPKQPGHKLLLVIDQFEELITLCQRPWERKQFLQLLLEASQAYTSQFRLLVTLRSDFEPQITALLEKQVNQYEAVTIKTEAQGDNNDSNLEILSSSITAPTLARFFVPLMTPTELREVIEKPAAQKVLFFDPPELVETIITEVGRTSGALPLLSFTLSQLYLRYLSRFKADPIAAGRNLTGEDYEDLGGVIGSLRKRANEEYEALDEAGQAMMRRVMLRMVSIEGGEVTRRKVPLSELKYSDPAEMERVETALNRLTHPDVRLLVRGTFEQADGTDAPYVEPAHDELVRAWKQLQDWIRESVADLPLQRELNRNAVVWFNEADQDKKRNYLWQNNPNLPRLEEIVTGQVPPENPNLFTRLWQRVAALWQDTKLTAITDHWLNELELNFVQASVERRQRDARQLVWTTLGVILVLTVLAAYALIQQGIATENADQAVAAQQTAVFEGNIRATEVVSRTTAEAVAIFEGSIRATEVVSRTTAEAVAVERQVTAETAQAQEATAAAIAAAEANARATEVVVRTTAEANAEERRIEAERQTKISNARALMAQADIVYPDNPLLGLRLALEAYAHLPSGSEDETVNHTIQQLMQTGQVLKLSGHVYRVYYSADGRFFVVRYVDGTPPDYLDNTPDELRRVDNGAVIAQWSTYPLNNVEFSPDSNYLYVGHGNDVPGELLRTADGTTPELSGPLSGVGFSLDDPATHYFVYYSDETQNELRYTDGDTIVTGLSGPVAGGQFYSNGHFLLQYSNSISDELRHTVNGELITQLASDKVEFIKFSPDNRFLTVKYADDNDYELRRAGTNEVIIKLSGPVNWTQFSPDSRLLWVGYYDPYLDDPGSYEIRRIDNGDMIELSGPLRHVNFSPNNHSFVVKYRNDIDAELRHTNSDKVVKLSGPGGGVDFSPNGRAFVIDYENEVRAELRYTDNNKVVKLSGSLYEVRFSPDNRFFTVEYSDGSRAELRRTEDGKVITKLSGTVATGVDVLSSAMQEGVEFSPNSRFLFIRYTNTGLSPNRPLDELRRTDGGEVVKLSGPLDKVLFSETGDYFIVRYSNGTPNELRGTDTPDTKVKIRLLGNLNFVEKTGTYLSAALPNNTTEIWKIEGDPVPLTRFEGLSDKYFLAEQQRLIVDYENGNGYLVDLDWLDVMGGYPLDLIDDDLIDLACMPFAKAKGFFTAEDEAQLIKEYLKPLGINEPQSCGFDTNNEEVTQ